MLHRLQYAHERKGYTRTNHSREQYYKQVGTKFQCLFIKAVSKEKGYIFSKNHRDYHKCRHKKCDYCYKHVAKLISLILSVFFEHLVEDRDERRGDCRSKDSVKQHSGYPARRQKCKRIHTATVKSRKEHIPNQSQHLAEKCDYHNIAYCFHSLVFIRQFISP